MDVVAGPDGPLVVGRLSGGAVALTMAWLRPDLYHRVLTYSGSYVNSQWPLDPETRRSASVLHSDGHGLLRARGRGGCARRAR